MPKRPKPPRIPRGREDLWRSLRVLRVATSRQLAAVCERPKNSIQVDLRYLMRTGYVRADKGGSHTLMRDTGTKPPMFAFEKGELLGAIDRNTREVFGVDGQPAPAMLAHRGNWSPKAAPQKGRTLRKPRKSRAGRVLRDVIAPHMKRKFSAKVPE